MKVGHDAASDDEVISDDERAADDITASGDDGSLLRRV